MGGTVGKGGAQVTGDGSETIPEKPTKKERIKGKVKAAKGKLRPTGGLVVPVKPAPPLMPAAGGGAEIPLAVEKWPHPKDTWPYPPSRNPPAVGQYLIVADLNEGPLLSGLFIHLCFYGVQEDAYGLFSDEYQLETSLEKFKGQFNFVPLGTDNMRLDRSRVYDAGDSTMDVFFAAQFPLQKRFFRVVVNKSPWQITQLYQFDDPEDEWLVDSERNARRTVMPVEVELAREVSAADLLLLKKEAKVRQTAFERQQWLAQYDDSSLNVDSVLQDGPEFYHKRGLIPGLPRAVQIAADFYNSFHEGHSMFSYGMMTPEYRNTFSSLADFEKFLSFVHMGSEYWPQPALVGDSPGSHGVVYIEIVTGRTSTYTRTQVNLKGEVVYVQLSSTPMRITEYTVETMTSASRFSVDKSGKFHECESFKQVMAQFQNPDATLGLRITNRRKVRVTCKMVFTKTQPRGQPPKELAGDDKLYVMSPVPPSLACQNIEGVTLERGIDNMAKAAPFPIHIKCAPLGEKMEVVLCVDAELRAVILEPHTVGNFYTEQKLPLPEELHECLRSDATFNYLDDRFHQWLKQLDVRRREKDTDYYFARKVFLEIASTLKLKVKRPDCSAAECVSLGSGNQRSLNNVFVATMRANKIPACCLYGRNIDDDFAVQNTSLFYLQDIGWVPCDQQGQGKKGSLDEDWVMRNFGQSSGGQLVLSQVKSQVSVPAPDPFPKVSVNASGPRLVGNPDQIQWVQQKITWAVERLVEEVHEVADEATPTIE